MSILLSGKKFPLKKGERGLLSAVLMRYCSVALKRCRSMALRLCGTVVALLFCGSAFAAPFIDNGSTVTDTRTGLVWQKQDDGATRTWGSALSYCEVLSLGGATDWRLPNIKELESLTDDTRYNPSIDPVFTGTKSSVYWSSTTYAYYPDYAWYVDFYDGYVNHYYKYDVAYVRCVRGGQSESFGNFEITDELGNAITSKAVDEQFQIKVTAMNADGTAMTNYTGTVYISATNGGLSLSYITISTGGTATATVSNNTPGTHVQISAMGGGMSGTSSAFNITGGVACSGGTVGGKVTQYKTPLSGATVYLTGYSYSQQTTSGSGGSYSFTNVPPGSYKLSATYSGGESRDIPVTFDCGGASEDINVYKQCNLNEKTPVLLVPGIAGSTWKKAKIDSIPTMPRNKSLQWIDPDLIPYDRSATAYGWTALKDVLISNGYKEGCTFFEVPYDWRKDNDTVVEEYLRNWQRQREYQALRK